LKKETSLFDKLLMDSEVTDIQMSSEPPIQVPEVEAPPNPSFQFLMPSALGTAVAWPSQPVFAMGRAAPRGRNRRNERFQRQKPKIKKVKPSTSQFAWPAFPLSIQKSYGLTINLLLGGFPRSSIKAVQHFHRMIAPSKNPTIFSLNAEDIKKLGAAFFENIRARWSFRQLVLLWKIRRCKKINEEDPMTMESIKQPVEVYDIYNKAIYTFEAKSLARAWKSNLLNHDGVFPEPKSPINPLTNLSLPCLQLHLALQTIRKTGHIDWVLDSFASSNYDLIAWEKKFSIPLKIESLTSIFADKSSYDRFDMLMDFAELQHDYHGLDFPKKMFEWVFQKHQVDEYEDIWIRACKKYYVEKSTLIEKEDIEELDIRSSVINSYLVEIPTIVKVMYEKYLERLQENGRRRVPPRQIHNRIIIRQGNGNL
jgi:hypothetical protein